MKKKAMGIVVLLVVLAGIITAAPSVISADKAIKTLAGNTKEAPIVVNINLEGIAVDENNNVTIPSLSSDKYQIVAQMDLSYIKDRLAAKKVKTYLVELVLTSKKPKVYSLTQIIGIETVEEYVIRKESETNDSMGLGYITNAQVEIEKKANKDKGLGEITNAQANKERGENEKKGFGKITNVEVETEKKANKENGYGEITNAQADKERAENGKKGLGKITNEEVLTNEKKANKEKGLGEITNAQADKERAENEEKGLGKITNTEVETEKKTSKEKGLGEITNFQADKERAENEEKGLGKITNTEVETEKKTNKEKGLGEITNFQADKERAENEEKELGKITNAEVETEKKTNKEKGLGEITNLQVSQKEQNSKAGLGNITNAEADVQRAKNEKSGLGKITDEEIKSQKAANKNAGRGEITNYQAELEKEKNKNAGKGNYTDFQLIAVQENLKKGKEFEKNKQWVHALAYYYDLMAANPTEESLCVLDAFETLEAAIQSGNPGFDDDDPFSMYDGWANLIEETKQYWSEYDSIYSIKVDSIEKRNVDYTTKTGDYSVGFSIIKTSDTEKYKCITKIIESGFKKAKKNDWNLEYSSNNVYTKEAVSSDIEVEIQILDSNGKDLVGLKNVEINLNEGNIISGSIYGISQSAMKAIDSGEVIIKIINIAYLNCTGFNMVRIPDRDYMMMTTEVTETFYNNIISENNDYKSGYPKYMYNITSALKFANALSIKCNLQPVYSFNGVYNYRWDIYEDETFEIDNTANGFRLPTVDEWIYAAKGGEKYKYPGSNNLKEVAVCEGNRSIVGQKKPNKYGLYDMCGNLEEMCLTYAEYYDISSITLMGGCNEDSSSKITNLEYGRIIDDLQNVNGGLRLICPSDVDLSDYINEDFGKKINIDKSVIDRKYLSDSVISNIQVYQYKDFEMIAIPNQYYEMQRSEVTTALYYCVTGIIPSGTNLTDYEYPVKNVGWADAIYFCNKLSMEKGYNPCYSIYGKTNPDEWNKPYENVICNMNANGYRLPTEDEWEYAAKGGENYKYAGSDNIDDVAWYNRNSSKESWYSTSYYLHEVATKKANGYGLYDMCGNVQELCVDSLNSSKKSYIYRGGSCENGEIGCELTYRQTAGNNNGFRIVRTVKEIPEEIEETIEDEFVEIPDLNIKLLKTELTQKWYCKVMNYNPSNNQTRFELPVENVSWYDAIYFCNKLSIKNGYTPCYSVDGKTNPDEWKYKPHNKEEIKGKIECKFNTNGYRLPTEEEWQYAAKGGEKYKYSGSDNIGEVAWNSSNSTHKVASKKNNAYGLFDMTGNVSEWCWNYYKTEESSRVYKGGGYNTYYSDSEISDRNKGNPSSVYKDVGFRIVRTIKRVTISNIEEDFIEIPDLNIRMLKTEVTQEIYENVIKMNPSINNNGFNLPVENVSWYDAIYFCNKLSVESGYTPCYSVDGKTNPDEWKYKPHNKEEIKGKIECNFNTNGYRLPTEEEWQYAAKGGEKYKYSGSDNIGEVAWNSSNSSETTHKVAIKKNNAYGLFDMTGNVSEWCWNYYKTEESSRVYKGGGCNTYYSDSEITDRNKGNPSSVYKDVGFRIVRINKFVESKDLENDFIEIPDLNIKMLKTELIQEIYEEIIGLNPSINTNGSYLPVENVSWYDAIYFCNKLSIKNGYTPCYGVDGKTNPDEWKYKPHNKEEIKGKIDCNFNTNGYRLPTEEEWEYAAEAGVYSDNVKNNDTLRYIDILDELYDVDKEGKKSTQRVAITKANPFGMFDMKGNVKEWCWDTYNISDTSRVIRGSSYVEISKNSDIYERSKIIPSYSKDEIGFRLVRTIKPLKTDDIEDNLIEIPDIGVKMLKTELMQKTYERIMGNNPSDNQSRINLPVERVSWYDAIYFCNKFSIENGYNPCYSVDGNNDPEKWNYKPNSGKALTGVIRCNFKENGYRLPTEAEWEFAAEGGKNNKYAGSDEVEEIAWYSNNSMSVSHKVATKKPNAYGFYDMSGNILEWCWDETNSNRILKGGSWYNKDYDCEISKRKTYSPDRVFTNVGFRVVRTINISKIKSFDIEDNLVDIPKLNIKMLNTEVTQKMYEEVLGENPSYNKKVLDLPVEKVSWYDAIYFCNKLSIQKGYVPCYSVNGKTNPDEWNYTHSFIQGTIACNFKANGYRLPKEDEWEFAAKGGKNFIYAGSDKLDEIAWYNSNSGNSSHKVATKKANPYGLYDMSGNLREWCWNRLTDSSSFRVVKGGSWYNSSASCEIYNRIGLSPGDLNSNIGFRIVRSN